MKKTPKFKDPKLPAEVKRVYSREYWIVPGMKFDMSGDADCDGCVLKGGDCLDDECGTKYILIDPTQKAYKKYITERTKQRIGVKTNDD